ncbi:MAG TPA: 30S ribosomal protein S6 [Planctomycetota bacterium]|nr:30S ribosomal protein S6 [Planctomycetota bacterium]
MKSYEGMFVLHNRELPEGENATPEQVATALVEKAGGTVAHALLWTNRKLAYPIAGNQTGTYVLVYFTGPSETCAKLNREVSLSDRCLRHLSIVIEKLPTAEELPGPLAEPVARPARSRAEDGMDGLEGVPGMGDMGERLPGEEKEKKLHESLDYKNVYVLRRLVTSQGKLFSRVRSNLHARHQRELRQCVLRARVLALLPFVAR